MTRRTGSATDLGFVLAAQSLTLIAFVLFGGVIADRLPRQRIMVASDLARALLHGALPQTIEPAQLQEAQALSATTANLAILVGPAVGTALVLTAGAGTAFALDAATFAVSAALLMRVDVGEPAPRVAANDTSLLAELRGGWREVASRPWVGVTIAAFTIAMFTGYASWYALAPAIARNIYGGASAFGVLESVAGGGALLGAVIGLRWRPRRPLVVALWLTVPWTLQSVAFALHAPLMIVIGLAGAAGCGFAVFEILWDTALATYVPAGALSRVNSYDWMGSLALLPLGAPALASLRAAADAAAMTRARRRRCAQPPQ